MSLLPTSLSSEVGVFLNSQAELRVRPWTTVLFSSRFQHRGVLLYILPFAHTQDLAHLSHITMQLGHKPKCLMRNAPVLSFNLPLSILTFADLSILYTCRPSNTFQEHVVRSGRPFETVENWEIISSVWGRTANTGPGGRIVERGIPIYKEEFFSFLDNFRTNLNHRCGKLIELC